MIPLTDEVETVAVLRRAGVPAAARALRGPRDPRRREGAARADDAAGRVRRLAARARASHRGRRARGARAAARRRHERPGDVRAQPELRRHAGRPCFGAATTRKIYVAAARGITPSKGAITRDLREDGKLYPARTRYRRLAVAAGHSVLRVVPEQGRTHQNPPPPRRHRPPGARRRPLRARHDQPLLRGEERPRSRLPALRAHRARSPGRRGARLLVEAPLPGDLRAVLERTSGPGDAALPRPQERARHERHVAPAAGPGRGRRTTAAACSTSTPARPR